MYRILALFAIISTLFTGVSAQANNNRDFMANFRHDVPLNEGAGIHIGANEDSFYFFEPAVRDKTGALISVGSFRVDEMLADGKFEYGFYADRDSKMVEFNKLQIQTFIASPTGAEFLATIIGRPDLTPKFAQLIEGDLKIADTIRDDISGTRSHAIDFVGSILDFLKRRDKVRRSFFADSQRYQKVRNLALKGNLFSVLVDIAKPDGALKLLGEILRKEDIRISILDVSNILQSLIEQKALAGFIANVDSLPFSDDALILQTAGSVLRGIETEQRDYTWAYISLAVPPLISILKNLPDPRVENRKTVYVKKLNELIAPRDQNTDVAFQIGDAGICGNPMGFYASKIVKAKTLTRKQSGNSVWRLLSDPIARKMSKISFEDLEIFRFENGDEIWIGNRPGFEMAMPGYHSYEWLYVAYVPARSPIAHHAMMLHYSSPAYNTLFKIRDFKSKSCAVVLTPAENDSSTEKP